MDKIVNSDELTREFHNKALSQFSLDKFIAHSKTKDEYSRQRVACLWQQFSQFIPQYLLDISSKLSQSEMSHTMKQIAFEELGSGSHDKRHALLFWQCSGLSKNLLTSTHRVNCNKELYILKKCIK